MSGIYNGHLLEFPLIRVDAFRTQRPEDTWLLPHPQEAKVLRPAPVARLHLLSHVHTDHLTGLEDAFTSKIVCHPDTKRMLLRLEAERDRRNLHEGKTELVKRKYAGLVAKRQTRGGQEHWVDTIETLPYGVPKEFDLGWHGNERCVVNITLLDANHCPGSAMFLITAKNKAVIHTGDVRADRVFMQRLMREPALQEFLVPSFCPTSDPSPTRRLDRVYVDTSQSTDSSDMPQKEDALRELVQIISMYPPDTVFFLNTWCWGWEEIIIAVAKAFGTKVHLDRYKLEVYGALSSKFMEPFVTSQEMSTRFHACERLFRCDTSKGKRVVSVGMAEVNLAGWDVYAAAFRAELAQAKAGEREWPTEFKVPFARHSSLPELRNFVAQFRPRSVSLNTKLSDSQLFYLHEAFAGTVSDASVVEAETRAWFEASPAYGWRWLQAMDLQAVLLPSSEAGAPEPRPFLGIEGTMGAASEGLAKLLADAGAYFRASKPGASSSSIAQPDRASNPSDARNVKLEPADLDPQSKDVNSAKRIVLQRRKKRRVMASRTPSKYAVSSASLSKLIKRPPSTAQF